MKKAIHLLAIGALMLAGCHSITEELPTQPTSPSPTPKSGVLTVSIPAIPVITPPPPPPPPAPVPTPTPAPTPTPTPPSVAGCPAPLPVVSRMNTKVHIRGPNLWTLDTTPLVGPDYEYCKEIGFPDRNVCPVRPEGNPERVPCETYAVGKAKDTGRAGPTWYRNGKLCTGAAGDCENHPDNQYLLKAYGSGHYEACTADGLCGGVQVDR